MRRWAVTARRRRRGSSAASSQRCRRTIPDRLRRVAPRRPTICCRCYADPRPRKAKARFRPRRDGRAQWPRWCRRARRVGPAAEDRRRGAATSGRLRRVGRPFPDNPAANCGSAAIRRRGLFRGCTLTFVLRAFTGMAAHWRTRGRGISPARDKRTASEFGERSEARAFARGLLLRALRRRTMKNPSTPIQSRNEAATAWNSLPPGGIAKPGAGRHARNA